MNYNRLKTRKVTKNLSNSQRHADFLENMCVRSRIADIIASGREKSGWLNASRANHPGKAMRKNIKLQ